MLVEKAADVFFAGDADDGVDDFAVLEDNERWDAADVEPAARDIRILVDVHLPDRYAPLVLLRQRIDRGGEPAARAAPFRPEIHQNHAGLRFLVEIAVGERLHIFGCHLSRLLIGELGPDALRTGPLIHFDVLPGRRVPGKILGHAGDLDPLPGSTVPVYP